MPEVKGMYDNIIPEKPNQTFYGTAEINANNNQSDTNKDKEVKKDNKIVGNKEKEVKKDDKKKGNEKIEDGNKSKPESKEKKVDNKDTVDLKELEKLLSNKS